jgi:predicted ATPase
MQIKSVHVRNFRSLLDLTVALDRLTALVGANGSGKSSVLRAMELFYATSPRVGAEDFYGEDTSRDIEIELAFSDLDPAEQSHFGSYLEAQQLSVVRLFSADAKSSGKYYGSRLQNPDFAGIRRAGDATAQKPLYESMRQQPTYADLPKWTKQELGLAALAEWERQHQGSCARQRDDGQFFGFTEVAQGYLGRSTRLIVVPAVRDAAEDATDTKTSAVGEIMELVVRSVLARREELQRFKDEMQKKFQELYAPENLAELQALESELSSTLRMYAPDAGVALGWLPTGELQVPIPKANVKLVEDGYGAPVGKTGHGLQRAFILTMLQYLAVARSKPHDEPGEPAPAGQGPTVETISQRVPDLVLAIEEPELYQHPNRQRHLARVLVSLASGSLPGVSKRTQVVYATHSPLFVGLDRFDQIRLFRKSDTQPGRPRQTKVVAASLEGVAETLWRSAGSSGPKFTVTTMRPRLAPLMTPWMSEGFFASVVVLVEGESDRAALLGAATAMGHDLEKEGISVIPCLGKSNLDRPHLIFREFGIPTYVVWDNDKGGKDPEKALAANRYLLRLLGQPEEDWPSAIRSTCAALAGNLEAVLENEIGSDVFAGLLAEVQQETGFAKREDALKNPVVVEQLLQRGASVGVRSPTLEAIVNGVVALKG